MEFWHKIRSHKVEDLIFIDEAGVNLAMTRLYARAIKGQRAKGTRPQQRGKNVSMIGAIALKGIVGSVNLLGAADGLSFEAFIVRKLVPNIWPGACVILDNCSIHKGKEIESAITRKGIAVGIAKAGASLIYLPPYSPDFNPIENFWSKVKNILRSISARTYQTLEQAFCLQQRFAIAKAFKQISLQDIRHWFTYRCYCTSFN